MMGRSLALLVALGLTGVACGGGGDETATSTEVTAPDATPTTHGGPETSRLDQDPATGSVDPTEECVGEALANGTVSTVGYDEVTFGMTVAAAEEAAEVCMVADRPVNQDCYHVVPASGPEGLAFLVTAGTIERVDVFDGDITTRSGLGIGSTEQEVLDSLGEAVQTRPHPLGGGNELVFVPSDEGDADFRVVFETNGETVTRFRSGRIPQVDDPQPCPGGDEPDATTAPVTTEP